MARFVVQLVAFKHMSPKPPHNIIRTCVIADEHTIHVANAFHAIYAWLSIQRVIRRT